MSTILKGSSIEIDVTHNCGTHIIGERINPTGKKRLQEALKAGNLDYLAQEAMKQEQEGASIIDVNVSLPGIDQEEMLPAAIEAVTAASGLPISIDSSDPKAIEAALLVCPGRPLINSTTGEEAKLSIILPLAKQYHAAVIVLCFDESGIPMEKEKRLEVAEKTIDRAIKEGLDIEDIIFDPLITTLGSNDHAARISLETIAELHRRYYNSMTLGASNVSFGLPDRPIINSVFLTAAILYGVNAPICDPGSLVTMDTIRAVDLVKGNDSYAARYLAHYRAKLAAQKK
jgi:5-methyltetrahydrofolate--homocysteine methyltransferase